MTRRTIQSTLHRVARMAALSMLALAACEPSSEVVAGPRAVPLDIARTLTGAVSTPIFPTAPPGERQAFGDARGLNGAGQVTGAERDLTGYDDDFRTYRFTPGGGLEVVLARFAAEYYGADINHDGLIAGTTWVSQIVGTRAFVATGTAMTVLDILPGVSQESNAQAAAVNDAGTVAGWSQALDGTRHAVTWSSSGAIQDLGTPNSQGIDINLSGQVIGSGPLAAPPFYLWTPGSGVRNLSTELGALTSVIEINDAGQIIGTYTASGGASHAFLYTPGSGLRDLGTLGGATSAPTGLNGNGQVVGTSLTAGGVAHAFLWTPTGGMEDVTASTGVNDIRRLNNSLQTLTGAVPPNSFNSEDRNPQLVQLQVTNEATLVARFTWSCEHKKCEFDASSSTSNAGIASYSWNLDKTPHGTATGVMVTAVYPHGGTHDVTLTITDNNGQTATVTQTISAP